ncbi:8-amino-7-oxononanoate synthase [Legionella antarctica]|uniref:8-amino-7-oxononanoate synthase n=1 Tax=Legionella antarctica TaxID=2708020 RepID=A0A6F8T7E8_9GAMM|nr:aminotransferase class I/II-fold pyridoxal phosphate-dependent enzyme [Legionella antarctica]BCA95952.1 8-amino-7-oxononanoate synthase [Legionella antarctica]
MAFNKSDIFDKCYSDKGNFAAQSKEDENYLISPILHGPSGPHMQFQNKPMIVWTINDYLGLAQNTEIQEAGLNAVRDWSTTTPMGARLMSGNTVSHVDLENKLASFTQKDAAILFIAGYLGVLGTITGLVGKGDTIIIDQFSHACMIDAAFLAQSRTGVKIKPFKHNDMMDLERQLKLASKENQGGILIVTEGIFGMRGDLANLPDICTLKEKYNARLFLDDAHALGVIGNEGRGSGEYFNLQNEIDLYFGTFAKAFVSIGGFASGPREVISYLRLNSRPAIFSKAHPLVLIHAIDKATDLIIDGKEKRLKMWQIATVLQTGLKKLGFDLGQTQTQITPVYIRGGDIKLAIEILHILRDEYGIFVTAVSAPVVPLGTILFRLVPTAAHSLEDVEITLSAFQSVRNRLGLN